MQVVGLVVEYNPLHNGHLYHYQQALKTTGAQAAVAIMSGNFLQRGEPAIVNKWARAKMALSIGIDLVLELPVAYCTQNAETFAFGAVSSLDALGIVDYVCFGSESGNITWLNDLADLLAEEPPTFRQELKKNLEKGLPYPQAYANAASSLVNIPQEWLGQPNNILGLNYILALKRLHSRIKPATITRVKAGYHQETITDQQIASATAIRKSVFGSSIESVSDYVPSTTYEILLEEKAKNRFPISWDRFYPQLIHGLMTRSAAELHGIYEMEEGLEYRLKQKWSQSANFEAFMEQLKTKRYTWNRLQRLLLYSLLNLKKEEMEALANHHGVPYVRVLGFNDRGKELLHRAKKSCQVPIISRIPRDRHPMLDLDVRASQVYALGQSGGDHSGDIFHSEFLQTPIIYTNHM